MPWILQVLGLQKNNLTFTDEKGNVVKMVKPEPKWVKALKNPVNAFKKKKADFLKNNSYGSPGSYIENVGMFKELIEECTSSTIGLQTIHDCLSQKLDPNLPFVEHKCNRAMHFAARHGSVYMAMMLLKAGAKLCPRNSLGQTPLHIAASGRLPHHTTFLRWLLSKEKVNINEKDRGGNTALVLSVISCARTNVGILLHYKATVTVTTKKLLTYEDPEALAIAKYVRAVDNSSEDMDLLIEAKKRKREIKKMQAKEEVKIRNLEAARREIAAVQSKDTLARLYGKTKGGAWVRQSEEELVKKRGFDEHKKINVEKGGRAETKSRWEFREIEGDRSLMPGLDTDKFIGYDLLKTGGKTLDELKEEKAIERLAADLEFLDGKKISELEFHQKDFRVGGLNTLKSREGERFKNGQRVVVVGEEEYKKKGIKNVNVKERGRKITGLRGEGEEEKVDKKKGGLMSKFSFSTGWAKLAPGEEVEPPREREEEEEEEVMETPEERRERKRKKKKSKKEKKRERKDKKKEKEERVEERSDSDDWSD
ncbi:hypothetical protein TL16_g11264 [Triparma laevis f. inornata]|uniref:Uncharacterized protein n=1 Tax=Triparma laevis f. inornata TaxID=1714386 RepID=A0A9W7ERE1_9STRA|nr:hypothetical protein TL16_g11264 [Triparma laevis f. inornata]